jgi:hypothetical protein
MSSIPDTALARNRTIIYAATGPEEMVMMSVEVGRYYGLNAVATRIWELLETPRNASELCRHILEEFDVDAATCEAEVRRFVGELLDHGIIREAPA